MKSSIILKSYTYQQICFTTSPISIPSVYHYPPSHNPYIFLSLHLLDINPSPFRQDTELLPDFHRNKLLGLFLAMHVPHFPDLTLHAWIIGEDGVAADHVWCEIGGGK